MIENVDPFKGKKYSDIYPKHHGMLTWADGQSD